MIWEAMAPCTYVGHTLGAAPGGRIRFESLEFVDIDGPMPISGFYPSQVLLLEDLNFMADHLGQLHLCEGTMPPPHMSPWDPAPREAILPPLIRQRSCVGSRQTSGLTLSQSVVGERSMC